MREGTERTSEAKAPSRPILRHRDELDLPVRPSPTLLPEHALRLHLRVSLRVLEPKLRKLHRAKEAQKAEQREVVPSEGGRSRGGSGEGAEISGVQPASEVELGEEGEGGPGEEFDAGREG